MPSTTTRLIRLTADPSGTPVTDHPKPDRLLRGNPLRETWNLVDTAQPAGQVYCGVWRCEPGRWRIVMGANERELFTVLQGRCRVHDAQGGFEEAGPNEGRLHSAGFFRRIRGARNLDQNLHDLRMIRTKTRAKALLPNLPQGFLIGPNL